MNISQHFHFRIDAKRCFIRLSMWWWKNNQQEFMFAIFALSGSIVLWPARCGRFINIRNFYIFSEEHYPADLQENDNEKSSGWNRLSLDVLLVTLCWTLTLYEIQDSTMCVNLMTFLYIPHLMVTKNFIVWRVYVAKHSVLINAMETIKHNLRKFSHWSWRR